MPDRSSELPEVGIGHPEDPECFGNFVVPALENFSLLLFVQDDKETADLEKAAAMK